jgi:hypothetical protein
MMRSLLVAAALGLGLLSAATSIAAAGPFGAGAPAGATHAVTPVQYQRGYDHRGYHRPHYMPPSRHHWHRHAPPRHEHYPRHQPPQRFGARH